MGVNSPPTQEFQPERDFDDFEGGGDYQGWENEDYTPSNQGYPLSRKSTNTIPFQQRTVSPLNFKGHPNVPDTPGVFSG